MSDRTRTCNGSPRLTSEAHADATSAFAHAKGEMQTVVLEGMALEQQGKLDDAATKRIEARLQAISTALDREMAERAASIDADYASSRRFVLPRRLRVPVLAALAFVASGVLFELTLGAAFIFSGGAEYRAVMPWIFAVLLPPIALGWIALERANHDMSARYPTRWVRWLLVFPLITALSASSIVVSPLGWAALSGWVLGTRSEGFEAKVVSIRPPSTSARGCVQRATLQLRNTTADVCLDGHLVGRTPKSGDNVTVAGRASWLGVYIEEVRSR